MFCSTVIPTIGRSTLDRAVNSVLNQEFTAADFEIIVVNDSGRPLPEADWQQSDQVKIIATNRHNRSVARNTGAAMARGKYLHFLDDDDWMLPGAFNSFWELASSSQAAWLYGGFRLVDNTGDPITEICPDETGNCYIQLIASEWLPIQASLIEAKTFFAASGFASLSSLLGGCEDIDLSRQIARYHDMTQTTQVVASIRVGDEGSTTNYVDMFNQNRQSREKALNTPGAFTRMTTSAVCTTNASYWSGRIIYYYLASLKWNLQHRRLTSVASRGSYILAGFVVSSRYILSRDFWRGITKPYFNRVRTAMEASSERNLYANTIWR